MNTSLARVLSLLLGSLALTAQAVPITGQINIQAGSVVLTPNVLGAVTSVGASTDGKVTSVEGAYPLALLNDLAVYKAFNVAVGPQVIANLWTVSDILPIVGSGFTYSFDLSAITTVVQTASNLFINGTGFLNSSDPSLSSTAARWAYGINAADGSATTGVFSFQSNNVANRSVPDGGSAAILLGLGLMGIAGVSRALGRGV